MSSREMKQSNDSITGSDIDPAAALKSEQGLAYNPDRVRIEQIRARAEAATPAPWYTEGSEREETIPGVISGGYEGDGGIEHPADAEFIAFARSDCCDPTAVRYAATYGQAGEDEAPLFLAAADDVERLREQLVIANGQIRQLCAESESQLAEIRGNEAELLKRGVVIENLWRRLDELVAERNARDAANCDHCREHCQPPSRTSEETT